jgi:hypothetical protein
MPNDLPQVNTHPPERGAAAARRAVWRFRVREKITDGPAGEFLVKARTYRGRDGETYDPDLEGPTDYIARLETDKDVGRVFNATIPEGGTGIQYGSPAKDVQWTELGAGGTIPPGTGRGKVFQLLDDLNPGTPGWDYVRFT